MGAMIVTLYFPFGESVSHSNWSDPMRTIITQWPPDRWMRDLCDGWRRVVRIGEGLREGDSNRTVAAAATAATAMALNTVHA